MNVLKTAMLLAALTALLMGVGYLVGGTGGALVALLVAAAMNLFAFWNSGNAVLRMHNARAVDERSAPGFVDVVRELAERANLPMPAVYLIDEVQPNAFATGRNPQNAAVAATTGLLDRLSREEVAAVMAHELAHVQNRDTLTMTITATLAGAISMLTNFALFFGGNRNNNPLGIIGVIVAAVMAPLVALLVQMAISRTREYSADRRGAEICGNPLWLASALRRIEQSVQTRPMVSAERNPATAHMFIINPLTGHGIDNLFSTHPKTANRIAALEQMSGESGLAPLPSASSRDRRQTARPAAAVRPGRSAVPSVGTRRRRRGPWG